MAKQHIKDFLTDLNTKYNVFSNQEINGAFEWLDMHYDTWFREFPTSNQSMFSAIVQNPDNLVCNLTYIDLCIDYGQINLVESIMKDPRGQKTFADCLQILHLYIKFKIELKQSGKCL